MRSSSHISIKALTTFRITLAILSPGTRQMGKFHDDAMIWCQLKENDL